MIFLVNVYLEAFLPVALVEIVLHFPLLRFDNWFCVKISKCTYVLVTNSPNHLDRVKEFEHFRESFPTQTKKPYHYWLGTNIMKFRQDIF